jgi:hypothetical protein
MKTLMKSIGALETIGKQKFVVIHQSIHVSILYLKCLDCSKWHWMHSLNVKNAIIFISEVVQLFLKDAQTWENHYFSLTHVTSHRGLFT